jgi:peptidoglycan/LPS O-acetylase OafA/YrhL
MHRFRSIDALRALAALAVMAFHYEAFLRGEPIAHGEKTSSSSDILYSHLGLMGVELFFVISGFVILLTLDRDQSVARFITGRIGRLYPAYFATVIFAGSFLLIVGDTTPGVVAINFTLLQTFLGVHDLIPPFWTLAYEVWFYVVMSLIVKAGLLNSIDRPALAWLAFAFALRLLGIELGARLTVLTMLLFGHLFIAGMMIYRITAGKADAITFSALALCVLYSAFGRNDWAHISPAQYFIINGIFIAAVWAAASGRNIPTPSWLVSIGVCSYSLYLFHGPIIVMIATLTDHYATPRWVAVLGGVLASFGIAFLSRAFIEVPGQALIRRRIFSITPAPGRASAVQQRS